MSTIERVEYYSGCPSCGAASEGKEVCPYCGTSLVKKRYMIEVEESAEDIIAREDAGLPVVRGALVGSSGMDTFLKVFCPLFGGIFVGVSLVLMIAFGASGLLFLDPFMILFFVPFLLIGFGAFVPLFVMASRKSKVKNGRQVPGIVRGYEDGGYQVNGRTVQNMRVRINDGGQVKLLILSTGSANKPYPVDSSINMLNAEDLYTIV